MSDIKKRGLGRTLETLLAGSTPVAIAPDHHAQTLAADGAYRHMPLAALQRGQYQPRQAIDPASVQELAESIKSQGMIQPIVVRQLASGRFEIIAGERRFHAAAAAGLTEVPVLVRTLTDEEALAIALIENIQRENLNPLEEATALHRLSNEFNLTHQAVAEIVGRSRVAVSNLLRLLTLNSDVKAFLEHGDLDMGHARALLALTGLTQSDVAKQIVNRGLSVREAEALVRHALAPTAPPKTKTTIDPDIRQLQQRLSDTLGANVRIDTHQKGRGKLIITYHSLDELEGILAHIK